MKRFRSTLWILAAITGGSVYAAWWVWQGQLGTSLADEIAAAKREGVPVDPSDLIEPEVPESENAARPYLTAVAHAKTVIERSMWSKKLTAVKPYGQTVDRLTPANRLRLKALILPLEPALDALERASLRPRLNLHRSHDFQSDYSDVSTCKQLIRAIELRAELGSIEGDWQSGLADLEMTARIAALFSTSLTSYDVSMRSVFERGILESLARIAARHSEDPDLPARIRKVVEALGSAPEPGRVLAEFAWSGRRSVAYFGSGGDSCTPGDPLLRLRSIREANEAQFVAHWRQVYRTLPKDPLDFDGLRECLEEADARSSEVSPLRRLVPVWETAASADFLAKNEAYRRVARGAADILTEWRSTGRLPRLPADPFGGQLRCRVIDSQCVVYSVGPDRKDDGGIEPDQNHRTDDIVWRFPLPKRDPATIRVATR